MSDITKPNNQLTATEARERKLDIAASHLYEMEQVPCHVEHIFGPGLYIRQVSIPAGTFSIGHYQKTRHMNVMLKGRVVMVNQDGSLSELVAPCIFVSEPGRKAGYIVEDMLWQNIYATDETDVETLESMFIEKDAMWKEHEQKQLRLLTHDNSEDFDDYLKVLQEQGMTEEEVQKIVQNELDQIPLPDGSYKMMVATSRIHGKGVFATSDIKTGEIIAPALLSGKRTPAGRYTNHSKNPNAIMVKQDDGNIYLVAKDNITGCRGGFQGNEITIDYRQALNLRSNLCQQSQ